MGGIGLQPVVAAALSELSYGLLAGEKGENVGLVATGHEREVSEVTLLLLGLLGEDVALEGVLSLDLS